MIGGTSQGGQWKVLGLLLLEDLCVAGEASCERHEEICSFSGADCESEPVRKPGLSPSFRWAESGLKHYFGLPVPVPVVLVETVVLAFELDAPIEECE